MPLLTLLHRSQQAAAGVFDAGTIVIGISAPGAALEPQLVDLDLGAPSITLNAPGVAVFAEITLDVGTPTLAISAPEIEVERVEAQVVGPPPNYGPHFQQQVASFRVAAEMALECVDTIATARRARQPMETGLRVRGQVRREQRAVYPMEATMEAGLRAQRVQRAGGPGAVKMAVVPSGRLRSQSAPTGAIWLQVAPTGTTRPASRRDLLLADDEELLVEMEIL